MALFYRMQLTARGLALQTKVQGGGTLHFTRIALGDGQLGSTSIAELQALISEKVRVPVDRGRYDGPNTYSAGGSFTNQHLQTGFTWRELGLFATDPEEGEILYCYANAQGNGDYIPGVGAEVYEKVIYAHIGVGNSANVTVEASSAIYPTEQELEETVAGLVPKTRTINGKGLDADVILTAGDVNARPSTWLPTANEIGADPAGSASAVQANLSTHINNGNNPHGVTIAQIGAVPTGRKVNGKALSVDISLTAGDVGASPTGHTHTPASIGAATAAEGVRTLGHSKSGSTHLLTGLSGATGILSARFKATAAFVAGNVFTVDGTTYTATLASGDSLPDSAFVSGALVEVLLDTSTRKLGFKAGGVPVGTLPSQSGLTATAGNGQVVLRVTRPNSNDYAGTLVVRKTGSTPTGPNDGTRLDLGTSTSYTNTGLSNGVTYYYRAFAYNSKKQYQTLITGATVSATPIAGIALSTRPVGGKIRLSVGGTYYNFIIVNQGRPSTLYDTSCDGTWLLIEKVYIKKQWVITGQNMYSGSPIDSYVNSVFIKLFDSSTQSIIKEVKIPYCVGYASSQVNSGANGLPRKVFLLSGYEVGWSTSDNQYFPIDGSKLSYFNAGTSSISNGKRIAYLDNVATNW